MKQEDKPGHPGLNNEETWERMTQSPDGLLHRIDVAFFKDDTPKHLAELLLEASSAIGNLINHGSTEEAS